MSASTEEIKRFRDLFREFVRQPIESRPLGLDGWILIPLSAELNRQQLQSLGAVHGFRDQGEGVWVKPPVDLRIAIDAPEDSVFLVHTSFHGYKAGEPLLVTGVRVVNVKDQPVRACFHVRPFEGDEDDVVISDTAHYRLVSRADVRACRLPGPDHSL